MRQRLLVGPAQWWDRTVVVGWWVSVDLALRAGVKLPVLARIAHVSLDSAVTPSDPPPAAAPAVEGPGVLPELSLSERRRLHIVDVLADRWPFGEGQCLRSALVTGRMLDHLHPRLSLGVARRPNGELTAHAWLELDGGARLGYADGYERLSPMGE